ncbi:MAG: M23 family metallopeptidase [Bacteroidetes bacterium]|nr:M23 family metallopeptidase [Bacteroidota bacterium]
MLDYLKSRYRLVVMNDDTFEEQASFRLSRINLYLLISVILVTLNVLIISIIVLTPLKEYIPGYQDVNLRRQSTLNWMRIDSLERKLMQDSIYLNSVRKIASGEVDTIRKKEAEANIINLDAFNLDQISAEDSLLRAEMENEDRFRLLFAETDQTGNRIEDFYFFPPIKGFVTSDFEADKGHFGIDIVAPENEAIKTTLDGTVIQSSWTLDSGHVIVIQHDNNLVSFYKHNSVLLKKVGTFVSAGDVIAIIGSSGEFTTGPHLHFELWHEGVPLDPRDYIVFN